MAKRYIRINWQNKPNVATPINATNLNKMDKGIDDIDKALDALETSIVGQIVNDPSKINNAAVIFSLKQSLDALNNNLVFQRVSIIGNGTKQVDIAIPGILATWAPIVILSSVVTSLQIIAVAVPEVGKLRLVFNNDTTAGQSLFVNIAYKKPN